MSDTPTGDWDDQGIVSVLTFNLAVSAGVLVAFAILRKRPWARAWYDGRETHLDSPLVTDIPDRKYTFEAPLLPFGMELNRDNWVLYTLFTPEEHILRKHGFDIFAFLRWQRYVMMMLAINTVLVPILIGLNNAGSVNRTLQGSAYSPGFFDWTIANIDTASDTLWAHVIVLLCMSASIWYAMYRYITEFAAIRRDHVLQRTQLDNDAVGFGRTVLIDKLAPVNNSEEHLLEFVQETLFPEAVEVQIVRQWPDCVQLREQHTKLYWDLDTAIWRYQKELAKRDAAAVEAAASGASSSSSSGGLSAGVKNLVGPSKGKEGKEKGKDRGKGKGKDKDKDKGKGKGKGKDKEKDFKARRKEATEGNTRKKKRSDSGDEPKEGEELIGEDGRPKTALKGPKGVRTVDTIDLLIAKLQLTEEKLNELQREKRPSSLAAFLTFRSQVHAKRAVQNLKFNWQPIDVVTFDVDEEERWFQYQQRKQEEAVCDSCRARDRRLAVRRQSGYGGALDGGKGDDGESGQGVRSVDQECDACGRVVSAHDMQYHKDYECRGGKGKKSVTSTAAVTSPALSASSTSSCSFCGLMSHTSDTCELAPATCPRCGLEDTYARISKHMATHKRHPCQHCMVELEQRDMETHVHEMHGCRWCAQVHAEGERCDKEGPRNTQMQTCANVARGCRYVGVHEAVDVHLEEHCAFRMVTCPTCNRAGPWMDMRVHLLQNTCAGTGTSLVNGAAIMAPTTTSSSSDIVVDVDGDEVDMGPAGLTRGMSQDLERVRQVCARCGAAIERRVSELYDSDDESLAGPPEPIYTNSVWHVELAKHPDDVIWENYGIDERKQVAKKWLFRVAMLLLTFFWQIPIGILSSLEALSALPIVGGFFSFVFNFSPGVRGFLTAYLPAIVLLVFNMVLPAMMTRFSMFEGVRSKSQLYDSTMTKSLGFQVVNTLVLPAVVIGGLEALAALLGQLGADPIGQGTRVAVQITAPKSGFFIALLTQNALLGNALSLLNAAGLATYTFFSRREMSDHKREELEEGPEVDINYAYADQLVMLAIGILFSVSIPVTVPYCLLFFCMTHFTNRHQCLYLWKAQDLETDGRMHVSVWRYVLYFLSALQLAAVGNFSAKLAPAQASSALILFFGNVMIARSWLNKSIKHIFDQDKVVELFEVEQVNRMTAEGELDAFHENGAYLHPGLKQVEHIVSQEWLDLRSPGFGILKEEVASDGGLLGLVGSVGNVGKEVLQLTKITGKKGAEGDDGEEDEDDEDVEARAGGRRGRGRGR